MIRALRLLLLIGVPLTLAVVLWFHPAGADDENIFEGVREDVGCLAVRAHPLLALHPAARDRGLRAAARPDGRRGDREPRLARLLSCFYTAYEVTIGLGSGVLVEYANGLPASEQAVLADAIKHYNQNDILGDPMSVSLALGLLGWVVAMLAAAVAFRRAGAGWPLTVLLGLSAFIAIHPPPVGPAALVCLGTAGVLIERWRARERCAAVGGPHPLPVTA